MGKVNVRLNIGQISELMRSNEVTGEVEKVAARMARAAGAGFRSVVKPHRYAARAFVETADDEGRERQATDHVLQKVAGEFGAEPTSKLANVRNQYKQDHPPKKPKKPANKGNKKPNGSGKK